MAGSIIELHTEVPADQESNVFGQFDEHLKRQAQEYYEAHIGTREQFIAEFGKSYL